MNKIQDIRERDLISMITSLLDVETVRDQIPVGPGKDDCAVLDFGGPELLVTSTDMLHRNADFPGAMTPWQMGWMSIAVTLSDIAAMGARPVGILTALGLPPDLKVEFVEQLVEGMKACAYQQGASIVGGDVDRHDELTIVGTALGLVDRTRLVRRKGAQPGDLVCVTGELGTAGAALDALEHDKEAFPYVLRKLYLPVPRIREGTALAGTLCLTSMMDISDGLALSLHDIAAASGVGFHIRAGDIPVHRTVAEMAADQARLMEWSLYTGGDFELLFTLKRECLVRARKAAEFTVIGKVTSGDIVVEHNGEQQAVEPRGFQQFGDKV